MHPDPVGWRSGRKRASPEPIWSPCAHQGLSGTAICMFRPVVTPGFVDSNFVTSPGPCPFRDWELSQSCPCFWAPGKLEAGCGLSRTTLPPGLTGVFYQVLYGCEVTKRPSSRQSARVFLFRAKTDARENGPRKEVERWLWGLSLRGLEVKLMGSESQID